MTQQPVRPNPSPRHRPCAAGAALACLAALVVAPPGARAQDGFAAALADSLLLGGDEAAAYAVLESRLASDPDDAEARWRAVRIAVALSVLGASHVERRDWALRADAHGRELERLGPDDPEALAWAAAARGRHALHEEGMRTPARLANETFDLTRRVLALRPDHPLAHHVRGKLCQQVAGLPRAAKLFARVLLGGELLGQATLEQAEAHHLRAVSGDPGMVFFYLDLGETLAARGSPSAAAQVFRAALELPRRFPVDGDFQRLISERLAALEGPSGAILR